MSKSIDFGAEITGKIKEAIKSKLAELGSYIDEELPDYIMIMIANRKTKAQMVEDLQLFLGGNTDSFVTWLQDMLQQQQLELASSAKATTHKKIEKQISVEKDKRRTSESHSVKNRADSDENSNSRNLDSSFRQDLDIKGGDDDFGSEKNEDVAETQPQHHETQSKERSAGHKRRVSQSVFDDDEPSPVKQVATSSRRRAVEQVPVDSSVRRKDSREYSPPAGRNRRRSRSKSPPRRSRGSRSRSRSPRGHYSKRVVASILASRQREHDRPRGDRNGDRSRRPQRDVTGHDRRSRDTPSDTDENERDSAGAVSSAVRVAQRKPAVPAPLQPTTSLLMRAIADAKHSVEGVPQSEIKVPPKSALAAAVKDDERDDDDLLKESIAESKRRRDEGRSRTLHVLSTSDGGFLSRSKQVQIKLEKEEERKRKIMSKLLEKHIEAEIAELAAEKKDDKKQSSSESNGEEEAEDVDEEAVIEKKKREDAEVRAFNQSAAKEGAKKTLLASDNAPSGSSSSTDALMKALFRGADDGSGEVIAIPLAPSKNNPQFIVTLEGVEESLIWQSQPKQKLPLSQRLEPRPAQSIQSRLGPPISDSTYAMEQDDDEGDMMATDFDRNQTVPPVSSSDMDTTGHSPLKTAAPATSRPAERCRFWPNCKTGDTCAFVHPSQPCKVFPNCRFGARCLYIHPNCKFDAACLNPECPYTHGNGPLPATSAPAPSAIPAATLVATPAPVATIPAANNVPAASGLPLAAPVASSLTSSSQLAPAAPPAAPVSSVPLCKFFPNCTNPFCLFSHPKPCRFGPSCYYKSNCTFWHPPSTLAGLSAAAPAMSKLKWTASTAASSANGNNNASNNTSTTNSAPNNAEPPSATAVN